LNENDVEILCFKSVVRNPQGFHFFQSNNQYDVSSYIHLTAHCVGGVAAGGGDHPRAQWCTDLLP